MSVVKRVHPEAAALAAKQLPDGGLFQATYPALWEYLAAPSFPDGEARLTSTLLLLFEDGLVKMCLTDRANERAVWVASDEVEACLSLLDKVLADDTAQWRRKAPWTGKKGK